MDPKILLFCLGVFAFISGIAVGVLLYRRSRVSNLAAFSAIAICGLVVFLNASSINEQIFHSTAEAETARLTALFSYALMVMLVLIGVQIGIWYAAAAHKARLEDARQ